MPLSAAKMDTPDSNQPLDQLAREACHARLHDWMTEQGARCAHLVFEQSTHSVEEAARAAGATPEDFIKSICWLSRDGRVVVSIVKGEDRADRQAVQEAAGMGKLRIASEDEVLRHTGYPAGGVPPFGFDALFLIDERVMEAPRVYGGGGSDRALICAAPAEIKRLNHGRVTRLRVVARQAPA